MSDRVALISDVHGNLVAFQAVLEKIDSMGIERIYSLGDLVGYGPRPAACLRLGLERCTVLLCGNHELEIRQPGATSMTPAAQVATDWTREELKEAGLLGELSGLPVYHKVGNAMLIHGSVEDPLLDYVTEVDHVGFSRVDEIAITIEEQFTDFDVCFVGHNHRPFVTTNDGFLFPHERMREFCIANQKVYVSVGSVGQPRDENNRSCFVTYDGEWVKFHRVEYAVQEVVSQIRDTPLPQVLGARLLKGI